MKIFAIFRTSDPTSLGAAIVAAFPNDHLNLAPGEWLVASSGTPKDISDKLGVSDGKNGTAIVFAMESYFGRATQDIWAWIKTKAEASGG